MSTYLGKLVDILSFVDILSASLSKSRSNIFNFFKLERLHFFRDKSSNIPVSILTGILDINPQKNKPQYKLELQYRKNRHSSTFLLKFSLKSCFSFRFCLNACTTIKAAINCKTKFDEKQICYSSMEKERALAALFDLIQLRRIFMSPKPRLKKCWKLKCNGLSCLTLEFLSVVINFATRISKTASLHKYT